MLTQWRQLSGSISGSQGKALVFAVNELLPVACLVASFVPPQLKLS